MDRRQAREGLPSLASDFPTLSKFVIVLGNTSARWFPNFDGFLPTLSALAPIARAADPARGAITAFPRSAMEAGGSVTGKDEVASYRSGQPQLSTEGTDGGYYGR